MKQEHKGNGLSKRGFPADQYIQQIELLLLGCLKNIWTCILSEKNEIKSVFLFCIAVYTCKAVWQLFPSVLPQHMGQIYTPGFPKVCRATAISITL